MISLGFFHFSPCFNDFFCLFVFLMLLNHFQTFLELQGHKHDTLKSSKIVILWLYLQETRVYLHYVHKAHSTIIRCLRWFPSGQMQMACLSIFWIALDSCWLEAPSPLDFNQPGLSVFLWCSHSFFIWFHNDVIPVQSLRASPLKDESAAVWVFSGFWYICLFFSWYFSPFHSLWQNDNIGIKLALLHYSYSTTNWLSACPQRTEQARI